MKTLNDIYDEVVSSDERKERFLALKTPEEVADFVKSLGVDASVDEIKAFLEEKMSNAGELAGDISDGDLKQVAGGKGFDGYEAAESIISLGIACALVAIESMVTSNCGTAIEGDYMLCDSDEATGW